MTSGVFSVARFGQQKIGLYRLGCVCSVSFKVGWVKATAGNLMPPNNHDFLVCLALHSTPPFGSHGHLFC